MIVYFDTNVLVAASVRAHPHHGPASHLLHAARSGQVKGCVSTHGLAEFYSVLTRTLFKPRIQPSDAGRFVDDNILPWCELIPLGADDYKEVLRSSVSRGLVGGAIFDMLHLRAAGKANCDRIYTFNIREFQSLAPPELASKIVVP